MPSKQSNGKDLEDREIIRKHIRRSSESLSGKCIDGPCNGVTVSASRGWDGLVQGHVGHRYVWNELLRKWEWKPIPEGSTMRRPGRPRG